MKKTALSIALALVSIVSASAGQFASEVSQNVKQGNAKTTTNIVQATQRITIGQYSAQIRGPKIRTKQSHKAINPSSIAIKSKVSRTRPLVGQHSDNGSGPKA